MNSTKLTSAPVPSEHVYKTIRTSVITAQNRIYSAVNSAMVTAYWEIGEQIYNLDSRKHDDAIVEKNAVNAENSLF